MGMTLRGGGAMWFVEVPEGLDAEAIAVAIYRAGVAVGCAGRYLRLFPAATIEAANLERACALIAAELAGVRRG
jgi:4-aminobutyrate aminotransferase-like enzyme